MVRPPSGRGCYALFTQVRSKTKYVCIMTDYAKDYKACAAP
jgi:hypothetical protein